MTRLNIKQNNYKAKYKYNCDSKKHSVFSTKNIIDLEYYIDSKIVKHMKKIKEINKKRIMILTILM